MLEYDFNQLDDDFITLWSKIMLFNNTNSIIEPLQRLAEKGQVNAIQCWYILKKPEQQNKKIDDIVDNYYEDGFNEALAIANRTFDRAKPELLELQKQITDYHEKGRELAITEMNEGRIIDDEDNIYFRKRDRLVKNYRATEYAKQLRKAAWLTKLAAIKSQSVFIWERLFEIYEGDRVIFDDIIITNSGNNKVRKVLRKRLKVDPENTRAKFALGKSLFFFSDKKKEFEGACILADLAKRPLISCTSNYSQNIDDNTQLNSQGHNVK